MIVALKSYWRQPIDISRQTDRRQVGLLLPVGVMIRNPTGGSGGNADTLNGQGGAYYLTRANHTGTQAQSTITGLVTKLADLDQTDIDQQAQINLKLDAADYNQHFLGLYASFFDLVAAYPTASAGDYAQVDFGIGSDVIVYAWDDSDQQWITVGSSPIANTDALPEGTSNLYFTTQRVRDTALSGLSLLSSLAITAADSVLSAFGKLQAQFNALATVATSGNYNDLSNKPSIDTSRTLLYTTPTPNKPITNTTINVVEDLNERLFDANYIIPANTLAVGDVYEVDAKILMMRSATVGSQAVIIAPYLNGSTVAPLGTATSSNANANNFFTISVTIRYAVRELGVSGKIAAAGYLQSGGTSFQLVSAASFQTFDTTQDLALNVAFRLNSAALAGDIIVVKSAQLYKLNNPS